MSRAIRTGRWPHRRMRLRSRIVVLWALGGFGISILLAGITYGLADHYLSGQRERSALRQTYLNARALRDELRSPDADLGSVLSGLELPTSHSAIVRRGADWYGTSVAIGRESLPQQLRSIVEEGSAAVQRVDEQGRLALVVGVPIPEAATEYYEVFALTELHGTLAVIRNALVGAAVATTVLGALLGWWASRRMLRPVADIGRVAAQITDGDLTRRLEPTSDPDVEELAESFNRMVDALQTRLERDARFASDVSHELRSPLTTIVTAASILEGQRDQLPERCRAAIDLLVSDVHRFQHLVQDLLELSRVDAGAEPAMVESVYLAELILHVTTATAAPHADSTAGDHTDFTVDIDPSLAEAPILTDKRRLERILANLLDNADSHGCGVTRVTAHGDDRVMRIGVEDRGAGIALADRERIFERFHRGPAAGRRGSTVGTGLGLALVAEHVRLLNGRVWVEDTPSGGARFVVEIPQERP